MNEAFPPPVSLPCAAGEGRGGGDGMPGSPFDGVTDDPAAFFAAPPLPLAAPACPKAVFLVAPEGFTRAEQSAADNRYMAAADAFASDRALAQHRALQRALAAHLPALCFPGDPDTPDAVFPNNVFATAPGRYLVGRMRHPVRQREADRADLHGFFRDVLGYRCVDLRTQPGVCELTGSLVIDRARGLGYAGLSERCDATGAAAMHQGFGLARTLRFALAPGEYHTNVVMSVLASRALVLWPDGFVDPAVPAELARRHAPHVLTLDRDQAAAFAGNCLAVTADTVWMSQRAADSLRAADLALLERAGFALRSVALDAIEAGGGSLRCCLGEVY